MEFNYDESSPLGPRHWGELSAKWSNCTCGQNQSPVDINVIAGSDAPTQNLDVHYRSSPAVLQNIKGHCIKVKWTDDAGYLVIGDEMYLLQQSHWHTPAEHTFRGKMYPLEMHTVYKTSAGKIAVIGVVYELGVEDLFISKLVDSLNGLIGTRNEEETRLGHLVHPDEIDRKSSYFRYHGSLTTPPCTEGVIWTLMEKAKTVSQDQLTLLQEAVHNMSNARPVQPINGRRIEVFKQGPESQGADPFPCLSTIIKKMCTLIGC